MKKIWLMVVLFLISVGLLVGCSSGGEQTSSETKSSEGTSESPKETEVKGTIKIGGLFDLTGGTGDVGTPYAEGEQAYFDYISSKGNINGYTLELIGEDYAYKIPEATKLYQKYKSKDQVAAILGWGTGDTEALRQLVAADKLPFISA